MARTSRRKSGKGACTTFVVRKGKGGRKLAHPKKITRCKGRKLTAKGRCRAGGAGWRAAVKANFRKGLKGGRALAPARFVACR